MRTHHHEHAPARKKKEWRREGGAFTQVDAKFPLLLWHSLFWEMLHLPVSHCSTWQHIIESLFSKRMASQAHPAKSVSGSKVFIVYLGSHCLLSEKGNNAKAVCDSVPHESKSSGIAKW